MKERIARHPSDFNRHRSLSLDTFWKVRPFNFQREREIRFIELKADRMIGGDFEKQYDREHFEPRTTRALQPKWKVTLLITATTGSPEEIERIPTLARTKWVWKINEYTRSRALWTSEWNKKKRIHTTKLLNFALRKMRPTQSFKCNEFLNQLRATGEFRVYFA